MADRRRGEFGDPSRSMGQPKAAGPTEPTGALRPGADFANLIAPRIDLEKLIGPKIDLEKLTGPRIDLEKLTGPKIDLEQLIAPRIDFEQLTGPKIDLEQLIAPRIDVEKLTGPKIDLEKLTGPKIDVSKLIGALPSEDLLAAHLLTSSVVDSALRESGFFEGLAATVTTTSVVPPFDIETLVGGMTVGDMLGARFEVGGLIDPDLGVTELLGTRFDPKVLVGDEIDLETEREVGADGRDAELRDVVRAITARIDELAVDLRPSLQTMEKTQSLRRQITLLLLAAVVSAVVSLILTAAIIRTAPGLITPGRSSGGPASSRSQGDDRDRSRDRKREAATVVPPEDADTSGSAKAQRRNPSTSGH